MLDASALHHSLLTLDSHVDIPWPDGPGPHEDGPRRVDFPKMRRGGLRAVCFAAFVPQARRGAPDRDVAAQRVERMLDAIDAYADAGSDIDLATTSDDVRAAHEAGRIAVLRAVENGHGLGGDLTRLAHWRRRGVRYLTLVHNGHNDLADSANPRADLGDAATLHGGLSPLGRDAVAEMNRLGMLVDVSHLSRDAMLQAVRLSTRPVCATHSCASALQPHPRNLDDMQIDALRDTGGVVQITAMAPFLKGRDASVSDFVDHLDHVVARAGVAHVGISSDFDGGGAIEGWRNASESPNITAELVRRGYGPTEISLFWSGNFLRVLDAA